MEKVDCPLGSTYEYHYPSTNLLPAVLLLAMTAEGFMLGLVLKKSNKKDLKCFGK